MNTFPDVENTSLEHLKGQYYITVFFKDIQVFLPPQINCIFKQNVLALTFPIRMQIFNIYIETFVEDKVV